MEQRLIELEGFNKQQKIYMVGIAVIIVGAIFILTYWPRHDHIGWVKRGSYHPCFQSIQAMYPARNTMEPMNPQPSRSK